MGGNDYLQLEMEEFILVSSELKNIKDIWMGLSFSIIRDSSHNYFALGNSTYGELGSPKNLYYEQPEEMSLLNAMKDQIKDVVVGRRNTFLVQKNGSVLVSGDNSEGQSTGDLEVINEFIFCEFRTRKGIEAVEADGNTTMFIDFDRTLLITGALDINKVGQNNKSLTVRVPEEVLIMSCRYVDKVYMCKLFTLVLCSAFPKEVKN